MSPTNKKASSEKQSVKEALPTDLSVGEILRRARVSSNQSLQDIEEKIRIRATILEHIELMELDKMPAWIYTMGFVRSYSEYLDLDGDKMIALLKVQVGNQKKQSHLHFPVVANESALPDKWILTMAGIGLFVLIALAFIIKSFSFSTASSIDVSAIPALPNIEQTQNNSAAEEVTIEAEASGVPISQITGEEGDIIEFPAPRDETGVILPAFKPEQIIDPANYRVIISVIEDSWIEIRDSRNRAIISKVLKSGEQYYMPNDARGYKMSVGNIAGIEVSVDGEVLTLSGNEGEVKRNVPLDPESLKEMFP